MARLSTSLLLVAALSCTGTADARRAVNIRPFVVIDVMEVYTSDAPADIETRIRTAVANLNADLQRSGVFDVQFNLVHVGPIDHYDMAKPLIHELRDRYRADLVGVWATVANEGGGSALVPDRANPLPYTGFHTIPTNQPIETHLLSHEIGHNLGLMHEDGICRAGAPAFRDIMTRCESTDISNSGLPTLVRTFTNPDLTYLGVPLGPQDAVSIIREIAPKVAAYR